MLHWYQIKYLKGIDFLVCFAQGNFCAGTNIHVLHPKSNCNWNILYKRYPHCEVAFIRRGFIKLFKIKLGVYYRGCAKEKGCLLEDLLCHIQYNFQVTYDTTSPVPKQSCSKKSNIVPFVLMINHKPVIACYLLQYNISSSFHIFSLFLSIKGSSNITAKQT